MMRWLKAFFNFDDISNVVFPFEHFYKRCTPEVFVLLLKKEQPQTIAFILSFCKKTTFVYEVLKLLSDILEKEDLSIVVNYLKNCENQFDPHFTRIIENYCDKNIKNYYSGIDTTIFRKNFNFKIKNASEKLSDALK